MKTFKEFLSESPVSKMEAYAAKTTNLTFVEDADKKHQYRGSELGNNNDPTFVAMMGLKSTKFDEREIFALDPDEVKRYGQNVYRYETHNTKAAKMRPVIKIDLMKGMVYFLTPEALEDDGTTFEKKGTKITYIAVYHKSKFLQNQK